MKNLYSAITLPSRLLTLFLSVVFFALIALLFTPQRISAVNQKQIVGYFAQWGIYGRNFRVKDVDTNGSAQKLTIINYAFANIVNGQCVMTTQTGVMDAYADYQKSFNAAESVDGVGDTWNQPLRGNFNQLKELKQKYPHIKVLISVGGWTWSKGFSDAASTATKRQQVVQSCLDIYIRGNLPIADGAGGQGVGAGVFDGIDIDWEFPANPGDTGTPYSPADTQNFTLLLQEFRTQLNAINPNLLLTAAVGVGVDKYDDLQLNAIGQVLNYVNIMSYDMHGGWENQTNFQARLYPSANDPSSFPANTYSIDKAVTDFINAGVPANKIILGVPFYGRGWTNVPNVNNGLYQSGTAAPSTWEAGIEDYKVLKNLTGYTKHYDSASGSMWIYNGTTFWTYDDPTILAQKMAYINSKGLGGAMAWELDGDDSAGSLMNAVYNGLNSGVTPTPTSAVATSTPTKTPKQSQTKP